MTDPGAARRPLRTRSNPLIHALLSALLKTSVTPNQISVLSVVVAVIGAWALVAAPADPALFLLAAGMVQLRLLCNLMDGLVAVEGGRGSALGGLYNEVPDRLADSLFLVAWGYACGAGWMGWLAALAAATTAYIRVLGGTLGLAQDFRGPMAKPHRMAALTLACVLAALEGWWTGGGWALWLGLVLVTLGTLATCGTRLWAIAKGLEAK